jgi:hypothetical protein
MVVSQAGPGSSHRDLCNVAELPFHRFP